MAYGARVHRFERVYAVASAAIATVGWDDDGVMGVAAAVTASSASVDTADTVSIRVL